MKTLYLECGMGAAGDMLTAALLELIDDRQAFLDKMNALNLPGVRVEAERISRCGITGTHMRVTVHGEEEHSQDADAAQGEHEHPHGHEHPHEHEHAHEHEHEHDHGDHSHSHEHEHHHHSSLSDITALIDGLSVSEEVKANAKAVYWLLADAESRVHGTAPDQIHFHEVGTLDAVADVLGVCLLLDQLKPDEILASPVHTGSGYVRCAHGVLPVPAPATALLLEGIPSYGGQIRGELCTPTGAALLRHFVAHFGDQPVMRTERIGYGMGSKEFERLNCVRAFFGDSTTGREEVCKLECNLDDMTGEDIGFAMERLFEEGARDVYTQSIGMKKCRPGIALAVICAPADADRLAQSMLRYTSTLGVRRQDMSRYVLKRGIETVSTPYGEIRRKRASGQGVEKAKWEYEDIAAAAREHNISPDEVRKALK